MSSQLKQTTPQFGYLRTGESIGLGPWVFKVTRDFNFYQLVDKYRATKVCGWDVLSEVLCYEDYIASPSDDEFDKINERLVETKFTHNYDEAEDLQVKFDDIDWLSKNLPVFDDPLNRNQVLALALGMAVPEYDVKKVISELDKKSPDVRERVVDLIVKIRIPIVGRKAALRINEVGYACFVSFPSCIDAAVVWTRGLSEKVGYDLVILDSRDTDQLLGLISALAEKVVSGEDVLGKEYSDLIQTAGSPSKVRVIPFSINEISRLMIVKPDDGVVYARVVVEDSELIGA